MPFHWDWSFSVEIFPRLIEATGRTLLIAFLGYAIALALGLVFAVAQRTRLQFVKKSVREFIEFIRSTPLVLQIFFVFFVAPQFGVRLSPWTSGIITIGLHYAAYLSEIYRAGIEGVPAGQWEACRALNLSMPRAYIRIIIPQAFPICLPGMGNYFISLLKDTPMLSLIGIQELMLTANAIGSENYRFLEPYTIVGVIFLVISLPSAVFFRWLEDRIRKTR